MKHPAADILAEIAEEARHNPEPWKAFEGKAYIHQSTWHEPSSMEALLDWVTHDGIQVRRRPRTIEIAGVEVPEPMREAADFGGFRYFIPEPVNGSKVKALTWNDTWIDNRYINLGFAHLTEDAARQHARALIIASGGDPDA